MNSARSSALVGSSSGGGAEMGPGAVLRPLLLLGFRRLLLWLGLGALAAMMGVARQSRRME